MRHSRYSGASLLLILLLSSSFSHSATTTETGTPKLNKVVVEAVGKLLEKSGFSPGDPRIDATKRSIGRSIGYIAAAGAGLRFWPALMVTAGISSYLAYELYLDSLSDQTVQFHDDGTITYNSGVVQESTLPEYDAAAWIDGATISAETKWFSQNGSARKFRRVYQPCQTSNCYKYDQEAYGTKDGSFTQSIPPGDCHASSPDCWEFMASQPRPDNANRVGWAYTHRFNDTDYGGDTIEEPQSVTVIYDTPEEFVEAIPEDKLGHPLNPALVSGIANSLWSHATKNDLLEGNAIPYSSSMSVTEEEVEEVEEEIAVEGGASSAESLTVADLLTSAATAETTSSSANEANDEVYIGESTSASDTVTYSTGDAAVDFGPDPNLPAPVIGPVDPSLLTGIYDNMVQVFNSDLDVSPSTNSSACPTASFTALGNDYVIDSHCIFLDQNYALIQLISLLCWSMMAFFIVMRS